MLHIFKFSTDYYYLSSSTLPLRILFADVDGAHVSGIQGGFVSDMYVVGMILKGKGATGFVNVRSGRLWDADIARGTQHVKPYPMLGGGVRLVSQKKINSDPQNFWPFSTTETTMS